MSIKSGKDFLKEDKDGTVYLPFKSTYSIFLKNLNSKKALVKISLDGEDIGNEVIINPNSSLDLERFLGDLNSGNKFLFTEKTKKISEHRGDHIDDGIIRVSVTYEQDKVEIPIIKEIPVITYKKHYYDIWEPYYPISTITWQSNTRSVNDSASGNTITCQSMGNSFNTVNCCASVDSFNTDGITVKGSISSQQFTYGNIGSLENNSTIFIFQLKGIKSSGVEIKEPVTKKSKIICEICGTENSVVNFCGECGNCLG